LKETFYNKQDIMDAFKNKKIASLLGMESGHAIDSSLAILRVFYELGIRYMTLTHNCNLPWATNHLIDRQANVSLYGGLTEFGRKVIKEMNRLGMIVDLSHVSYQTMIDALDETKAPVMFSHSSVFAVCNQSRNVRDDVLEKLVFFYNFFKLALYNLKILSIINRK
jgi:membrane dipeptidase